VKKIEDQHFEFGGIRSDRHNFTLHLYFDHYLFYFDRLID